MKESGAKAPRVVVPAPQQRRGKPVSRPLLAKSQQHGAAACVPNCPRCQNSLVWRGRWQCDACPATITWQEYSDPSPRPEWSDELNGIARKRARLHDRRVAQPPVLPARALAQAPLFSSSEGDNWVSSPAETEKSAARKRWTAWLEGVELATSTWRQKRAARHRLKSAQSASGIESAWHRDRERGQAERFDRIAACGAVRWVLQRHSSAGTTETPIESRCDCWRLCSKCLERRRYRLRVGIEQQRELAIKLHGHRMQRWYRGSEGRWSEKLFTLTVTHGESAADDARVLTTAWRELSKRIAAHLKIDREAEKDCKPVWVRALEVEPGASGGHAHLHLWWLGPFVDATWLHVQWGDILEGHGRKVPHIPWEEAMQKATDARARQWCRTRRGVHGRERASVPWPVVSLNAARSSALGKYATKVGVSLHRYVSKGASTLLQRVHPLHAASVYAALESARCVQWARGWAPKRERPEGVTYSRRRLSEEEAAAVHAPYAADDAELAQALDRAHAALVMAKGSAVECSHAPPVGQLGLLV